MSKTLDALFCFLIALVALGPSCLFACEQANISLPGWVTADDARQLAGKGNIGNNAAHNLTSQNYLSGLFQESVTNAINDRIPFKASAMLGYAKLQRQLIGFANLPRRYTAYHSYYGSEKLHLSEKRALAFVPYKRSEEKLSSAEVFGRNLAKVAQKHPEKRFVVYLVQGYQEPSYSPAYELVNEAVVPGEYADIVARETTGLENVFVASHEYASFDSYYHDFFKTDHHWNHHGIETAYNDIADWLGIASFNETEEIGFGDYRFIGSTARVALDFESEEVHDTAHDFSHLTVVSPDGTSAPYGHDVFLHMSDEEKRHAFYNSYYAYLPDNCDILGNGSLNAIVMANSYGFGIAPYLAEQYSTTTLSQALHPNKHVPGLRIEALIEEGGYDDFIFVVNPTDLDTFVRECQAFFDSVLPTQPEEQAS